MAVLELEIRKATVEDATRIWSVRNDAIAAECTGFYATDILDAWTHGAPSARFIQSVPEKWLVAVHQQSVVGTGIINRQTGEVDGIFVRPDMMRQGIGRRMMAYIESLAIQHGLRKLTLDSTLNAAAFYRSCGFVGDSIGVYNSPRGIALDCIPMEKELSPDSGAG